MDFTLFWALFDNLEQMMNTIMVQYWLDIYWMATFELAE